MEMMGELDAPTFIVTCRPPGERPSGCLIGFATQCSINPPRFLACLSRQNRTFEAAARAPALTVHVVPQDRPALAELFGGETGDEIDKFTRCAWRPGPQEAPILDDCPNWFVGRVDERLNLGDHVGFVLAPVAAAHRAGTGQLGLQAATRIEPGHPA